MFIQTLSLDSTTTVRVAGVSACDLSAASWRDEDLLIQFHSGAVLVPNGAKVKRLSAPAFSLVFNDITLPQAYFAPGLPQPMPDKAPHLPPFEIPVPVQVGKLPHARNGKTTNGIGIGDKSQSDDAWVDEDLDFSTQDLLPTVTAGFAVDLVVLQATSGFLDKADTSEQFAIQPLALDLQAWPVAALGMGAFALPNGSGSTVVPNPGLVGSLPMPVRPVHVAVRPIPVAADTVSGVVMLGPVVKSNNLLVMVYDLQDHLLGSEAVSGDGSYTVTLGQKPVTNVIRVVVVGVADGNADFLGEDQQLHEFVGSIKAVAAFVAGSDNKINVTQLTDMLARKLADLSDPEIIMAASAAFAKAQSILPKPTVAVGSNDQSVAPAAIPPDLYGQLLKTVFEQVKAAQPSSAAATPDAKAAAADAVLDTLAASVALDLSIPSAPVVKFIGQNLGQALLTAKVANYANTGTADTAPTAIDYQAAGIAVRDVAEVNAVAVETVKAAAPGSSVALVEVLSKANTAPTALSLNSEWVNDQIPDGMRITSRLKVGDLAVTDDALGANSYILEGVDSANFEVVGSTLYLKAGTVLDHEAKESYTITVKAQDTSLLGSTAAITSYTFKVANMNEAPLAKGTVNAVTATMGSTITAIDLATQFLDFDPGDTLGYSLNECSSLSAGLELNTSTGQITGTPTETTSGAVSITVLATDAGGLKAEQTFNLSVSGLDIPPPPAVDTKVPDWIISAAYQVQEPVAASLENPGSYVQGMGSIISNDVGLFTGTGALTPAFASRASWLGMTDSTNQQRKTSASMTEALPLSYGFQTEDARYLNVKNNEHFTEAGMEYTEAEKTLVRSVFAQFTAVANVIFAENSSPDYLGANMRLFKGAGKALSTVGEPQLPNSIMGFAIQPTAINSQASDSYGNLYLVTDAEEYLKDGSAFSTTYGADKATVTHELGHAMGLDHPFASDTNALHWFGDTEGITATDSGCRQEGHTTTYRQMHRRKLS